MVVTDGCGGLCCAHRTGGIHAVRRASENIGYPNSYKILDSQSKEYYLCILLALIEIQIPVRRCEGHPCFDDGMQHRQRAGLDVYLVLDTRTLHSYLSPVGFAIWLICWCSLTRVPVAGCRHSTSIDSKPVTEVAYGLPISNIASRSTRTRLETW